MNNKPLEVKLDKIAHEMRLLNSSIVTLAYAVLRQSSVETDKKPEELFEEIASCWQQINTLLTK